jgi:L-threonylcarbamoyladenylate synthase
MTPLKIVSPKELEREVQTLTTRHQRVAVLAQNPPRHAFNSLTWINAGSRSDLYARDLYANLRTLDKAGCSQILVQDVPDDERWDAVRDRLRRAATPATAEA